jgi:hypothetical protein
VRIRELRNFVQLKETFWLGQALADEDAIEAL